MVGHRRRGKPLHFAIDKGLWLSLSEVSEAWAGAPDLRKNLSRYGIDILVECHCGAPRGQPCQGQPEQTVHFGRRLRRLLVGWRHATELL